MTLSIGPQAISTAQRIYLCPGSARAAQEIPKGTSGPAAESGKTVHATVQAMLSGSPMPEGLTIREEFVTKYMVKEIRTQESAVGSGAPPILVAHEHPATIRDQGQVIWHGFMDRLAVWPGRAVIWDFKTGRAKVSHAVENVQARLYAVGTKEFLAIREINTLVVGIISAGEDIGEWTSKALFTDTDLDVATQEAVTIWETANDPDAKRIPGKSQCRYCPAFGTHRCPESIETAALLKRNYTDEVLANPRALGELYTLIKQIEPMGKKVAATLRDMLEKGIDGTGYQLGKPGKTPELGDPNAVFNALKDRLTADQFISAVSLSLPAIADALYEASKTSKDGKLTKDAARKLVDGILTEAGLLTYKPKAAPIVETE